MVPRILVHSKLNHNYTCCRPVWAPGAVDLIRFLAGWRNKMPLKQASVSFGLEVDFTTADSTPAYLTHLI